MLDKDVAEALKHAYQWELIAERTAHQAMERVPALHLDRMATTAQATQRVLSELMTAMHLQLPEDPGSNWQDSLVDLSRGHVAAQEMERAAEIEPALRPAASAVLAASDSYRELALEALMRIRPMS